MSDDQPAEPRSFNLMLRRPGSREVYLSPAFDDPGEYRRRDFDQGDDPRWGDGSDQHWALSLPHSCDVWVIGEGERGDVLADALRLRAELDQAIAALLHRPPAPGLNADNWGVSILLNRFLQDHLEDPGAELVAQAVEQLTGKPFERLWPKGAKHTPFVVCDCRPGEKYHCASDWEAGE